MHKTGLRELHGVTDRTENGQDPVLIYWRWDDFMREVVFLEEWRVDLRMSTGSLLKLSETSASFAIHLAFLRPRQRFGADGKNDT